MQMRKNHEIALFIIGCIFVNYFGKTLANMLMLPVWMDSVGTVLAAYAFGPVCGAVVGVTVNLLYSIYSESSVYYALTSMAVGIIVGICAKKGFLKDIFGILSMAFIVAVSSVVISTPLNIILFGGMTGNVWGDSMIKLLQEMGCNRVISYIVGEFYMDFVDKTVAMLLLFAAVKVYRKIRRAGQRRRRATAGMMLLLVQIVTLFLASGTAQATGREKNRNTDDYDFDRYVQTIYNGKNGLPGGMANDIVQTKDGVLWVGTYGGLYRYSGNTFEWMNQLESVKTVNCLYTDEAGRLWVGTNDNGLSICINGKISNVVNRENGLPSNSVRCIKESTDGYYYVGTSDCLVIMTLSGGLKVYNTIPDIMYADCISADENGNVAVVTEKGGLYLVRGSHITMQQMSQTKEESYNCCAFDEEGRLHVGTSADTVETYEITEGRLKKVSEFTCGSLEEINSIQFSEDGILFVCADNGAGYVNKQGNFCLINTTNFKSSIDHMRIDYQGNLWFTSSRLGLLRLCPSVFTEIYGADRKSENVVNTVIKWRDCLYIGTDSGLEVVPQKEPSQFSETIVNTFRNIRIRCLKVDSKNHLWICTSGKGIWEISAKGKIKQYDSSSGALGDKFRSVIEMQDGTMAVAGDMGITFIREGKVQKTIGAENGLSNPLVLSLCEREDGSLFAGTDGNGIAVIQNGEITETKKQENGLSSEVILRMVPDSKPGGLFVVTGNGLCYTADGEKFKFLDNFPYYNNYDLVKGNHGELLVLCSAGIYVVGREELLKGMEVNYELLDSRKGLRISLTPNSWNHIDDGNTLYLSGNTGVVSMSLNQYSTVARSYRMQLREMLVDGEDYPLEKGEAASISRGANRITITPEVVNYSINDPDVQIYLEGFDKEPQVVPQSELKSVTYTNLPAGKYTFHLALLDGRTGGVIAENTYQIVKEIEMYDNWWFRLYVGVVAVLVVSYLTWLFVRTQIQKTLRMQKMQLEMVRNQVKMGNETILTIAQAVDAKDERTRQHSVRVSEYSVMIAKKLGFSDKACEELRKIAMLHDIGKIGIPDSVLNKPEKLTDEEYEIMKSHVTRGADILKNFTLIEHVADGALYHHERYDGNGYVYGLKGEEIPLNVRIIGIADAFDAMTANRVYRRRLEMDYVLGELRRGSGTQFDPRLVDILLGLIEDGTIDVKRIYEEEGGGEEE